MKIKNVFLVFITCLSLILVSFTLPKNLLKKVNKEIKKTFDSEEFTLDEIKISTDINNKLNHKISSDNLFKISKGSELLGYAYVAKAPSKTDEFDYLILLNKELIITKTKVLIYREDYGGEIGSKRWLTQFVGKTIDDDLTYRKDIIAISGATISAVSMTNAINNFLKDLEILHKNSIL